MGHNGITQKTKQKVRGGLKAIIRQPIQTTQNHTSANDKLLLKPRQLVRTALIVAVYLLAFIILDLITKQYQGLPGIVAWYPPVGLTYALLLVFGMRFVPGVTIALFISSSFVYRMPQPAHLLFLWALIISLIYGAAAGFLRRVVHLDWQLRKVRDVSWFVITALLTSALLAVLSVISSALTSNMAQSEILKAIFDWWIGETIGVLTITPFLLAFVMPGLKRFMEGQPFRNPAHKAFPRLTLAVIGQTLSLVFTLLWVFGGSVLAGYQPLYLITLPLLWIALDHGFEGAILGIVAMNFGVMCTLWLFHSDLANLGELQLLMIIDCIVGLFMGAIVTERKQAEQVIQASEKKFRQLFENSPLGQSMTEINGSISVNNAFCEMLGYTREELANKKWQEITPEEDIPDTEKHIQVLLDGKKESTRFEKRYVHKNGSMVWAEVNSFLNRDAKGNPTYFITTVNNISERKKAEGVLRESEDRFRQTFDISPVGIVMVGLDKRFIRCNLAFSQSLGYGTEELVGKLIEDVTWPEDKLIGMAEMMAIMKGEIAQSQVHKRYLRKDGQVIWGEVTISIIRDSEGRAQYFLAIIQDITERKKAEKEILRLNQELEQRVKDRTIKLEATNQELDSFAYSVSHDLRAPLRAMEGYSEALKTGYPEKLDEQGQHYLTRIQEASLEMGQLIKALLSLSRVTRDDLKSESIDLSQLVREVADGLKKLNPNRKVAIDISRNMAVQGDAHLIKVVMENLVNNAFKFTSMRDQAHIVIGMKIEAGETIYYVRDDGVGFDMAYAGKLFVPFQRLHGKQEFPGTGIGLVTVKRIITRHGGRIWAQAGVDQGAAFYFTLGAV